MDKQGAPISYWHETRSDQLLQAVTEARNGKRELEEQEIVEIGQEFFGITPSDEEQVVKSTFEVAIEKRRPQTKQH